MAYWLIIYDLSAEQGPVKEKMKKKGYDDTWNGIDGKTHWLPATTLHISDSKKTEDQIHKDLKDCVEEVNKNSKNDIEILRYIVLKTETWSGWGKPYQ